jgi:hypothetical protein
MVKKERLRAMNEQLSFSLSDEVAPLFNDETLKGLCKLIDQKQRKGLRYDDLKIMLLSKISKVVDLDHPEYQYSKFHRAYNFVKYF